MTDLLQLTFKPFASQIVIKLRASLPVQLNLPDEMMYCMKYDVPPIKSYF